jgi:hypothetical protein
MDWLPWAERFFPQVTTAPFAERHERLWGWFDSLERGRKPRARVENWPRGGAKSSTAEMGIARVGAKLSRRFVLYICSTQFQAEDHVTHISSLFGRIGVRRGISKYGASLGWSHKRLRTENGFNVAALGLDVAARGIKLDQYRPDLMIFDDFDERDDTDETVQKKIRIITQSLLPAGSSDCAVLFLQNKLTRDGIMGRLVDGRADFLYDREMPTNEPAVIDLQTEWRYSDETKQHRFYVTGGWPTWEGQNLRICEDQINEWGLPAFLRESQHDVDDTEGGLWKKEQIDATRWRGAVPQLVRIVVGVDPNASAGGDEAGVVVGGCAMVGHKLHGFVLEDCTIGGGPHEWANAAVSAYHKWRADSIVAENNNGGEMVQITISTVQGAPSCKLIFASRGKLTRAEPVQKLYADGRIHHCGHFPYLEQEMTSYRPKARMDSPNRMDALVWMLTDVMLGASGDYEETVASTSEVPVMDGWTPGLSVSSFEGSDDLTPWLN